MKKCNWCDLTADEKQWLLLNDGYWSVYLADEQDYVGRCILLLNRHCERLSDLNGQEWHSLKEIIDRLEACFRIELGAELCNWSCLMNHFYKEEEPAPHLHIHVRPRYQSGVKINDSYYRDEEFGHHYQLRKDTLITPEDRLALFQSMKVYLSQ